MRNLVQTTRWFAMAMGLVLAWRTPALALQSELPLSSLAVAPEPQLESIEAQPTEFNTILLPGAVDAASVVVVADGVLLPRSQYIYDPGSHQVYLHTHLPPGTRVQVRFHRAARHEPLVDQGLGNVSVVGSRPVVGGHIVSNPFSLSRSPFRAQGDTMYTKFLVAGAGQLVQSEAAGNVQVFHAMRYTPAVTDEEDPLLIRESPSARKERGVAISGFRSGSMTLDVGTMEASTSLGAESARDTVAARALTSQSGSPESSSARWTRAQFGEAGDVVRGHYSEVSVDQDFAPVTSEAEQGATAAVGALGFMGRSDLFDRSIERKKIADLSGQTIREWGYELEPVAGLVWSQSRTEQKPEDGDCLGTLDRRGAAFSRGGTQTWWAESTRTVETGRLTVDAVVEETTEEGSLGEYSRSIEVTQEWGAAQLFAMPGGKARAVYQTTTYNVGDDSTGAVRRERTETRRALEDVAVLPGVSLGYAVSVVDYEEADTPDTRRTDYALNRLELGNSMALTGSLRRDETAGQGPQKETLKLGLGAAELLGLDGELDYQRESTFKYADDEAQTAEASAPVTDTQKTVSLRVGRELWNGFRVSFRQTATDANDEFAGRSTGVRLEQQIGPMTLHTQRDEVADGERHVVAETQYGIGVAPEGEDRPRVGLLLIQRGRPPVVTEESAKDEQPGTPEFTKVVRADVPIGPLDLMAAYHLNPVLKNGGSQAPVEGEALQYGASLKVGAATISGHRAENPIVGDNQQRLSEIDLTRYRLNVDLGDSGGLHVTREQIRDRQTEASSARWIAGASYQAGARTALSVDYYRNEADPEVTDVAVGEGYRVALLHSLSVDTTLSLQLVNPLEGRPELHRGMPSRCTRAFLQVDHAF